MPWLGVEKTRTTPFLPQSDGLVERFNKTLAQQLSVVAALHQKAVLCMNAFKRIIKMNAFIFMRTMN